MELGWSFRFSMCGDLLHSGASLATGHGRAGAQGAAHGAPPSVLKTPKAQVTEAALATFLAFAHRLSGTQQAVLVCHLL